MWREAGRKRTKGLHLCACVRACIACVRARACVSVYVGVWVLWGRVQGGGLTLLCCNILSQHIVFCAVSGQVCLPLLDFLIQGLLQLLQGPQALLRFLPLYPSALQRLPVCYQLLLASSLGLLQRCILPLELLKIC